MAGIKVAQHKILKISTDHIKEIVEKNKDSRSKNPNRKRRNVICRINLDLDEANILGEVVSLFDSQLFRLIKLILKERFEKEHPGKKYDEKYFNPMDYVCSLVVGKDDGLKVFNNIIKKGIIINKNKFKRFVGTTGGLKKNGVLFVNEEVIDELNKRVTSRSIQTKLVPAKYEAYKALTCSSSQPITEPEGILVVNDVFLKYEDTVIELDDTKDAIRSEFRDGEPNRELKTGIFENNGSDGFNLCTIEYMKKCCEALGIDYIAGGLCLRNKWLKGMMYPFPIKEFITRRNNGNSIVTDFWGNQVDINKVELILTESSLKLASSYTSIEDYIQNYKESGYEFAVTKICPDVLEDTRDLNYQYLQDYDMTDEDIKDLCSDTINYLKGAMGSNYENVINFLGISENTNDYGWQHALRVSPYMLKDPYIIDCIHRFIRNKVDEAKIGKLKCNANFQTFSNDPVCLMEHICGLEVKGLLKANECYSSYWANRNVDEILAFRSPMTCHNNIRKVKVIDNDDTRFWYQYMRNVLIVNSFDSFAKAENGEDADGDANFTTNNEVLLRCFKPKPAISCIQKSAVKYDIDEDILAKSNIMAFGNNVGTITNYVTSMLEVKSRFEPGSKEYKELEYRIECGQLYQQNCLDSIKGIISKPMPTYWSNRSFCLSKEKDEKGNRIRDPYLLSICADKKPYFMIYRYEDTMKEYMDYVESNKLKAKRNFKINLNDILNMPNNKLTKKMSNFIKWYKIKSPVGMGDCTMNRICWYIENEMKDYKSYLKKNSNFDYSKLKQNIEYQSELYYEYSSLCKDMCNKYIDKISMYKTEPFDLNNKDNSIVNRDQLKSWIRNQIKILCPNEDLRLNVILDLCYGKENLNKQFCWDSIGDLIVRRLEELSNEATDN